jgi:hypothetical protein
MPRNRNKKPCQVPGCRAWAMRGHTRCRSHHDPELAPRGGGAPQGNLNALKTGDGAHPLPVPDLHLLAGQVVRQPDQLPDLLDLVARSIHSRTGDPLKTLVALRSVLADLIPQVAVALFKAEFNALLGRLPPSQQGSVLHAVRKQVERIAPETTLLRLRTLMIESEKSEKTSTGTGPRPAAGAAPGTPGG